MRYIQDYKAIIRLGLPILIGQAGTVVVGFADNIMVGQYSTDSLASASFVVNVFNMVMFCCMGFAYGVLPLAGALFARGENRRIGALMGDAVAVNVVYALVLTCLMAMVYFNVHRLGQPAELLPLIRPYFLLYLAGLVPISLFNVFSQWSYAIKNTMMPMWITLAANVMNIIGNYALIYGHWGCPEMGLQGAGVSTLVSRVFAAAAIMCVFFMKSGYREFRDGLLRSTLSVRSMSLVFRTSMPVSMQMSFESASFSIAAVFTGWLGSVALASFQIIVIVGMLGFCLYYAIGSAVAVLVSVRAGQRDCPGMRRAAWAGYHVMLALATCSILIFVFAGRTLMTFFTPDPAVLALTGTLILPLLMYQLGDATQITFANALRGTSRVMPMLWIAFLSYVVVGIPSTYILGFPVGMGVYGVVLSFSISLFLAGALFLVFFLRATSCRVK